MKGVRIVLLGLLGWCSLMAGAQQTELYTDARFARWSQEYRDGHPEEALQSVTQDLVSASPHPFAPYVWCAIQYRLGHLTENGVVHSEVSNPQLEHALGHMPQIYYLYQRNRYSELTRVASGVPSGELGGPLLDVMAIFAALDRGDTELAFKFATAGVAHHSDVFILAWATFNIAEADEKARGQLAQFVGEGSNLRNTPFGRFESTLLQKRPLTQEWMLSAVDDFLKERPGDSQALRFKANHLGEAKRFEEAEASYRQAYEIDPFRFDGLGWERQLLRLHRDSDAHAVAQWLAELQAGDPALVAPMTEVNYANGLDGVDRYLDAKSAIEKALSQYPDQPNLLDEVAALAIAHHHYQDAVFPAQKASSDDPQNSRYAYHLLRALKETNPSLASAEYQKALQRLSEKNEDFYELGSDTYEKLKQTGNWVSNAHLRAERFPHSGGAFFSLSLALESAGDYGLALDALERSFEHQEPWSWWLGPYARLVARVDGSAQVPKRITALKARFPFALQNDRSPEEIQVPEPKIGPKQESGLHLVLQSPHHERVNSVVLSPDLTVAASGDEGGTLKLWDRASGLLLRSIAAHTLSVNQLVFTEDGKLVISAGDDAALRAWDPQTGNLIWQLSNLGHPVTALATHGDSVVAALSETEQRTFHVLQLQSKDGKVTGILDWSVNLGQPIGNGFVERIWISRDAKCIATLNPTEGVYIWDVATSRLLAILDAKETVALTDDFSRVSYRDGSNIVVADASDYSKVSETYALDDIIAVAAREVGSEQSSQPSDKSLEPVGIEFSVKGAPVVVLEDYSKKIISLLDLHEKRIVSRASLKGANLAAWYCSEDRRRLLLAVDYGRYSTMVVVDTSQARAGVEKTFEVIQSAMVNSVAFAPDGQHVVITRGEVFDSNSDIWDLSDGAGHPSYTLASAGPSIAVSPNGKFVADCNGIQVGQGRIWNVATGKVVGKFSSRCGSALSPLVFLRTGDSILWHADTSVYLGSLNGDNTRHWDVGGPVASVALTPDGQAAFVAVGTTIKKINFSGEVEEFFSAKATVRSLAVDDSGQYLVAGFGGTITHGMAAPNLAFGIAAWNLGTGKVVELQSDEAGPKPGVNAVVFRPGKTLLAAGQDDQSVVLWDIAGGKVNGKLTSHHNSVSALAFSADGKYLVCGNDDGSAILWDVASTQRLATFVTFGEHDWAVISPQGLFDGSPAGLQFLHYAAGMEPIELTQLKDEYYEPGLLAEIIHHNSLRAVRPLRSIALDPEVKFVTSKAGRGELEIQLHNRGGGIGAVQVLLNHKEIVADAREAELKANPNVRDATLKVDLPSALLISGENNQITVIAHNSEGYLAGRGFNQTLVDTRPRDSSPPRVFAIVVGISKYSAPPERKLDLQYSSKDAVDFAKALRLAAASLNESIDLRLFSSNADSENGQPTKDNIRAAFQMLAQTGHVRPKDVLVIFFAGHGVAVSGKKLYAFPTKDVVNLDLTSYDLENRAITSDELVAWSTSIPAAKQIMVLDTCGAAALEQALLARGQDSLQVRAIDELNTRTGLHVLMGSASDASGYEAQQLNQGLLTYALLEGLKGQATNAHKEIQVTDLFNFAATEVKDKLAPSFGYKQEPQVFSAKGQSFPIAMMTSELAALELARKKLSLAIASLQNRDENIGYDNLKLSASIRERLEDLSSLASRGNVPAILVATEDVPGTIVVSGWYTVKNGAVVANINFIRDGEKIGSANAQGLVSDPKTLVNNIVNAISKFIGGLS